MMPAHFNDRLRTLAVGLLTIALAALAGCTSKKSETRIHLSLPSFSKTSNSPSSSGPMVRVVIINVSGSGISKPIIWQWEARPTAYTPPQSVDLVVPKGSDRLVQVLAAAEDETTGAIRIFYGDAITSTISDTNSVGVMVTPMAAAGKQGQISGRYLRADGTGPTGPVAVRIHPPNKPPMVVERTWMFGGWFDFFSLEGVRFSYQMESSGELIFNDIDINSPSLLSRDDAATTFNERQRTARVMMPPHFERYSYQDDNGIQVEETHPRIGSKFVFGFFGPGAGSRRICYENSAGSYFDGLYTTLEGSNLVGWNGSSGPISGMAGVETVPDIGLGGTFGACPASETESEYQNFTKFDWRELNRDSGALGFSGPFRLYPRVDDWGSRQALRTAYSTSVINGKLVGNLTLHWRYLPGVTHQSTPNGIRGVSIFARQGVEVGDGGGGGADYHLMNGIACQQLPNMGFRKVVDLDAANGQGEFNFTIGDINPLAFQSGRFQTVVCPYVTNLAGEIFYSTVGADFRSRRDQWLSLDIVSETEPSRKSQALGACSAYRVRVVSGDGGGAVAPVNLEVQARSFNGALSLSSTCSPAITTGTPISLTIAAGSDRSQVFYFQSESPGFNDLSAEAFAGSFSFQGGTRIALYSTDEVATHFMARDHSNKMAAGQCYALELGMFVPNAGYPRPAARNEAVSFALGATGTNVVGTFHTSHRCEPESVASSFTIPANHVWRKLYFKPSTSLTGEFNLTGQISGTSNPAMTPVPFSFTLGPATLSEYEVRSWNDQFTANQCVSFSISATNSVGAEIHVQSEQYLDILAEGGTIYRGSDCMDPLDGRKSVIYRNRSQTDPLSFRPDAGSSQVVVWAHDSNGLPAPQKHFNLDAPHSFSIQHMKNGMAQPFVAGMRHWCYRIQLQPLKADGSTYWSQSPYAVNLELFGATGSFYSDSSCQSPTTMAMFEPHSAMKEVFAKVIGAEPSYQVKISYQQNPVISSAQTVTNQDVAKLQSSVYTADSITYTHFVKALNSNNQLVHPIEPIDIRFFIPSELNLPHRFVASDGVTQITEKTAVLSQYSSPQYPQTSLVLNGGAFAAFAIDMEIRSPFQGPIEGVRNIFYP
jgi:hypothetical protein